LGLERELPGLRSTRLVHHLAEAFYHSAIILDSEAITKRTNTKYFNQLKKSKTFLLASTFLFAEAFLAARPSTAFSTTMGMLARANVCNHVICSGGGAEALCHSNERL
jgi:hypothetical protein